MSDDNVIPFPTAPARREILSRTCKCGHSTISATPPLSMTYECTNCHEVLVVGPGDPL